MKSFFFGPAKGLYGTLHEPTGTAKELGVLLCYPGPPEYHMTYWAFRRLATQLARNGLATLRFDYSCTGDSAGAAHDGRLEAWAEDVATAAAELKELTGLRKVAVVGMRLGAAIAARAVARGLKASQLVLWEPVIRGERYLAQLEELDEREALRLLHRVTEPRVELGGYVLPRSQREALAALVLESEPPKNAQRVVLLASPEQEPELRELHGRWSEAGISTDVTVVKDDASVTAGGARDNAVLYTAALDAMVERLSGNRAAP